MTSQPAASLAETISSAVAHHQAGNAEAAEAGYRRALTIDPDHFDALHLLGVLHFQKGQLRDAIELIRRAVEREPLAFPAFYNLGLAHLALEDLDAARDCFGRAVELNPGYVEAHEQLAAIFRRQGNGEGELRALERVAALRPDSAGAQSNLGTALQTQGRFDAAHACYSRALELDPGLASALHNMGSLLRMMNRHQESVSYFRRAVALDPESAQARYDLGTTLHVLGFREEAQSSIETAIRKRPEFMEAHWARAMLQLPLVQRSGESPRESLAAFARALAALDAWCCGARVHEGYKAVGSQQPYYIAYHDENLVGVLSAYGDLCARLMRQWSVDQNVPAPRPNAGKPLRLAIVSGQVYDQSVWTAITRGFCEELDRDRFSIQIFSTGLAEDRETLRAHSLASSFRQGQRTLRQWVDAISDARPDAILYPEIGMNQMTARLAALRLAPLQLAAWGHPMTTGLPTIDCFLSGEAFEPEDAQRHYRERLVPLPNLGCCYRSLGIAATPPPLERWDIDAATPLLVCAGTPYKYQPAHDGLLVEIVRRLGRATLLFFIDRSEHVSLTLRQRIEHAFESADLNPRLSLRWIPRQERSAFFGIMQRADVYLDTIGFSGFNTAMQAIECGLPVVTLPGRFMRGRLATGILRRMGMADLIAPSEREYVDLVVRLCQDGPYRASMRERIERTRQRLYDDVAPVRALEDLLLGLGRGAAN